MIDIYIVTFFIAISTALIACLLGDFTYRKARDAFDAWHEKRVIAQREADAAKWNFIAYPRKDLRIKNADLYQHRITPSIPLSMRDFKSRS